jgi:hypothetical protein
MSIRDVEQSGGPWPAYVIADIRYFDDSETCHHVLQRHSDRLFSTDEIDLESLSIRSPGEVKTISITDEEAVGGLFDSIHDETVHIFLYIQQPTSWGKFLVTCELFGRILEGINVFAPFLDYVQAFGLKTREEDENFGGYHRRIYGDIGNKSRISYGQ